jgi:hypothetical protein
VIPAEWAVQYDKQIQCNFDDDPELEWLIVYRYDQTAVQAPYRKEPTLVGRGPIGAAIFDTQNPQLPQLGDDQGNPSPYPPTLVIPYRLLPDFYEGKGQGYLGETGATDPTKDVEIIFTPPSVPGKNCKVDEITVLGYTDSRLPTRLSMFRWQGAAAGYRGAHFIGNAWVSAPIALDGIQVVTQVTTYNRLENHRSLLCEVRAFHRSDPTESLTFNEDLTAFTLDFCYQSPPDPTYPEGVVVAYLRGHSPAPRSATAPVVPGSSYLMGGSSVPGDLVAADGARILSLTNPASATTDPGGGHPCTDTELGIADTNWLCGRESAAVETEIVYGGQVRRVNWLLLSVIPQQVNGDVHWRIQSATLEPAGP